ncbi:hypothetical protein [Vibrio nomapromontoriensis]|uniref:hypothetical protein n=1 Tax=Vibrio nomapromontoriensis TaxID=2910246 RepID=UPI003D0D96C6
MTTAFALLIGFVFVMPFLVLLHEIGHAIPILITGEKVQITLGSSDFVSSLSIGGLSIQSSLIPLNVGYCSTQAELTKAVNIVSIIGGPIVSALCAAILFALSRILEGQIIVFLVRFGAWFSVFQFLLTIAPIQYGEWFLGYAGVDSDGLRLIKLMRTGI